VLTVVAGSWGVVNPAVVTAAQPPLSMPGAAHLDLAAYCGTLQVIRLPGGRALCTHGPDPAPAGVDVERPQPLVPGQGRGLLFPDPPGDAPTQAAATPGIACYGDGINGNRVHALYAVPADRADRYDQVVASIRQWAAEVDAVFQSSAAKTAGTRRVRFVTDPNCNLVVDRVRLSTTGDDTFNNTIAELAAQGYRRADRKYLVWMDSTVLCGVGTYYIDDRPTQDNLNNGNPAAPGSVARIDAGCWGLGARGQSVEAHELMHTLGSVLPTAPNSTTAGHCDDDADRMCYADGSPLLRLRTVCPSTHEGLFDCDGDDYFSTAPRPGSFLASRWNTANSSFLAATSASPLVSIRDATISEGDSGTKPLTLPVTLSSPSTQPVTVRFATVDAAARAPDDYAAAAGDLTFRPGETSKNITVAVMGDRIEEVDEPFAVVLSSPANARLERAQAFATIIDNEPTGQGYWFVAADGGVFAFGEAGFYGSTGNIRLNQPIVGMAAAPSGKGYWLVASDGGVFAFGEAGFYGSTGDIRLNQPIVGMAATPTGKGYWFVARDGGVFAFGDARFAGSAGHVPLNQPIVGMAATPTGKGYWFVAADGGVFAFGDASFLGAPTGIREPIVAMAATPTGGGYWMTSRDGTVHAFGDARWLGSTGPLDHPVVGMASTPKGGGFWIVARDGGIFAFGDAGFRGSTGHIRLNQPIVAMTAGRGPRVR
jgi:hypothetical protein